MLGGNIYELDNTITGLNTIWADTIQGVPADYYSTVRSNIQTQIDNIIYNPSVRGETGAKGDQGIQGIQGFTGAKGDQGIQGIQGIQGFTGPKGDQGDRGLQGIQGPRGFAGSQGPRGYDGTDGLDGKDGINGLKGDTGPKGDTGFTGVTGPAADLTLLDETILLCQTATTECNESANEANNAKIETITATINCNTVKNDTITAKNDANTARDSANSARDGANSAASSANSAASSANSAASSANSAASSANSAASSANSAASAANSAATGAGVAATAAGVATTAAGVATSACGTATAAAITATGAANTATTNCVNATNNCNTATDNARTANDNANTAANNANTATTNCNTATTNCNTATTNCNTAAEEARNINSYFTKIVNDIYYSLGKFFVRNNTTGQTTTISPDYVSVTAPTLTGGIVTIANGIVALIKNKIMSVGYQNPVTGVYSLLTGIGVETSGITPFGYLNFRSFYSGSPEYDSRIYEASNSPFVTTNSQGKLVLQSKNIEANGSFKSTYFNDHLTNTPLAPQSVFGNDSEYVKIRYQNTLPSQGGHIIIKSTYAITLEAPYINMNGVINRNLVNTQNVEDFYNDNVDAYFEINNPINQTWNI